MSLLEERIQETLGRIIIKEENGESQTALLDKAFVLKLWLLSPSLLLLLWEIFARLG